MQTFLTDSWQRNVSEVVLIVLPLLVVAWDIVAELSNTQATISEVTIHYCYQHPVLPLLLGCLFGHLCWPATHVRPHWVTMIIVCVTILLAFCGDRLGWLPAMMPILPLVIGLPLGHTLWPQKMTTATGESLVVQTTENSSEINTRTMQTDLPRFHPQRK